MESAPDFKLNTRKKKSQTHPPLTLKNKPSMVDTVMAALEHREVTSRRHSNNYVHVSDVLPKHAPPHGPPHHPQHQPRSRFFSTFLSFCCKNSQTSRRPPLLCSRFAHPPVVAALFRPFSFFILISHCFSSPIFAQSRVVAVHHDAFYPY